MDLAYHTLKSLMLGLSLPPLGAMRGLGRSLGRLGQRLDKRHRQIVRQNLAASFPERDAAWVEATARACFEHLGTVVMEIPRLVRLSPGEILERTRFHGEENALPLIEQGRGVLLLTGHIGNWEWASLASGLGYGSAVLVGRPIDWPPADRLVNEWRTKTGHRMVPKAKSARRILKELKGGGRVGVLLDQNVDWYDGVWVDFFGRPACTNKGLALLALSTGAAVVPFYCHRADDGCFDVHAEPEMPLVRTGDKTQDVWQNTQNYTAALEAIIRRRPEQWFWLHQRWKTKPFQPWPRPAKGGK